MRVGVVAISGCFDSGLTGVLDVLRWAEGLRATVDPGIPPITTTVLAVEDDTVVTGGGLIVTADERLDKNVSTDYDVVIVPGLGVADAAGVERMLARSDLRGLTEFLRQLSDGPVRIAAACTGVSVLGEAGLLDGRRATTTWWLADAFHRRYPAVELDMEQMVVWSGPVITAGAAFAHIDLALSLVLRLSPQLASTTASMLLIDGRPAQSVNGATGFLTQSDELVAAFEAYARANLQSSFSVADAAAAIGTTRKTLERRTRDCVGLSPHDMVRRIRIERALHLRRVTALSMDEIAHRVGYRNASTLRALLRAGGNGGSHDIAPVTRSQTV